MQCATADYLDGELLLFVAQFVQGTDRVFGVQFYASAVD